MMVASKMVVLFASLASMAAFLQGCGKDDQDKSTVITTTAAATTQSHEVPAMCMVTHKQFDCHFTGTAKNNKADSEEECCQRCHDDSSCFAWVFYKDLETTDPSYHMCSLKTSKCELRANLQLVTGLKDEGNATTTTAAANVTTTTTAAANVTTTSTAAANVTTTTTTTTSTAATNATTTMTTTHEATVNTTSTTTATFNTSTTTLTGNTTAVSSSTTTGNTTALSTTTSIVTGNATATSTTTLTAAPTTAHATHTTTSKGEDAQQVEVIAI